MADWLSNMLGYVLWGEVFTSTNLWLALLALSLTGIAILVDRKGKHDHSS